MNNINNIVIKYDGKRDYELLKIWLWELFWESLCNSQQRFFSINLKFNFTRIFSCYLIFYYKNMILDGNYEILLISFSFHTNI